MGNRSYGDNETLSTREKKALSSLAYGVSKKTFSATKQQCESNDPKNGHALINY